MSGSPCTTAEKKRAQNPKNRRKSTFIKRGGLQHWIYLATWTLLRHQATTLKIAEEKPNGYQTILRCNSKCGWMEEVQRIKDRVSEVNLGLNPNGQKPANNSTRLFTMRSCGRIVKFCHGHGCYRQGTCKELSDRSCSREGRWQTTQGRWQTTRKRNSTSSEDLTSHSPTYSGWVTLIHKLKT